MDKRTKQTTRKPKTTTDKSKAVGQGLEVEEAKPKKRPYNLVKGRPPKKIDRAKVKQLLGLGVAESDVAKHQGVQPSSIHRYIQHNVTSTELEDFKAKRADALALSQLKAIAVKNRVLNHVIDMSKDDFDATSDQAKIGYGNLANVSAGTDFDKERIERNQSTGNYTVIVGALQDLQRLRDQDDGQS